MTSLGDLTDRIAVHPRGDQLLVPGNLNRTEFEYVCAQKHVVLQSLRQKQRDPVGFCTALPEALLAELRSAPFLVLHTEATAVTPFSQPTRISKHSKIGQMPYAAYRAKHPGTSSHTGPRLRVMTVHTPDLGTLSFDLDALSPQHHGQLFDVLAAAKVLVGYNVGIDLYWLFTHADRRPGRVLDLKLLVEHLQLDVLLGPYKIAAGAGLRAGDAIAALRDKGDSGDRAASLNLLALSLYLPKNSDFTSAEAWCVALLSSEHLAHCRDSMNVLVGAIDLICGREPVTDLPAIVDKQASWYQGFEAAIIRVAEASKRGVPYDVSAADTLRTECQAVLEATAQGLCRFPEFAAQEQALAKATSLGSEVTKCLVEHVATHGISLKEELRNKTRLSRDALLLAGCNRLPFWPSWSENCKARTLSDATRQYERFVTAGRVHPIITWSTATGRTAARAPSVQNIPRDDRFRRLVKARPGHCIVSLDFSAIELRIGAALAIRAASDLARICRGEFHDQEHDRLSWLLPALQDRSVAFETTVQVDRGAMKRSKAGVAVQSTLHTLVHRVLHQNEFVMAKLFRQGLDPHLVTALDLARRTGKIGFSETSLDWLATQSDSEQVRLNELFVEERQAAKACNFGLLYGMSAEGLHRLGRVSYGLNWTPDEAASARSGWLAIYPDLHLWQMWTNYFRRQWSSLELPSWNRGTRQLEFFPEGRTPIYSVSTLTNRCFRIHSDKRAALSYQNQGTGADILARSIANLPEDVANRFILAVHDELVFEVPNSEERRLVSVASDAMTQAAEQILRARVPIRIKAQSGATWAG